MEDDLEYEATLWAEDLYARAKDSMYNPTYFSHAERVRRNQAAIDRYELNGKDWITSIDYKMLKRWQEELAKEKDQINTKDFSRMIRVSGVLNDTLLSDIGELFGQCGKIEEIVFSEKARFVAEEGRGTVTVTFSTPAEALKAVLFNGSEYTATLNKNGWKVSASNKPEMFSTESHAETAKSVERTIADINKEPKHMTESIPDDSLYVLHCMNEDGQIRTVELPEDRAGETLNELRKRWPRAVVGRHWTNKNDEECWLEQVTTPTSETKSMAKTEPKCKACDGFGCSQWPIVGPETGKE